ncbi:MAG: threonine ammonia-lyase, biosynthetic [Gammaproteobacteria bacterium]|nr:threonine ammonia-lyase, biosynthetic [Gammaproteobacteria bacterium]
MLEQVVKKILTSRVYDIVIETPLQDAPNLSARLDHQVVLKREDLQPVFSFKIRGAYNKMSLLSPNARAANVVAASAGNHAQGVALAARKLGIKAHIVMGRNTPSIKVDAVRKLGALVVFQGDTYQQAADRAEELSKKHGYILIHPYDDLDVIAGQGTVGMEIMNHDPDWDAIFVPVGGGGLIAGISAYVKNLRPKTKIIGVEAEGSACLAAALKTGRRVRLPVDTLDVFADGVSVAQVGKLPFLFAKDFVDEVVTASTDEICAAIKDVFDDTRSIAEPSGALAVAGLKNYVEKNHRSTGKRYVAVVSGANVDFDRLRHISERAELGEHREAIFGVSIDEKKGSFRRFCRACGKRAVTEFNYRYASDDEAHVYVGLQIGVGETRKDVAQGLVAAGYQVTDMTDNEAAKLHVRHMVGGRVSGRKPELLYRFEFPERPGALLRFLNGLGSRWNITMFHYRNHGAAWGRVLVGFQALPKDRANLTTYLERIGYRYWEETGNPAVELFLR